MTDEEREGLLARKARIERAEAELAAATIDRNDYIRQVKASNGRGVVSEIAALLGMNRVTVSDLVNSPGSGSRGRVAPDR